MKKRTKEEKERDKKIEKEISKLNRSSKILFAFTITILILMLINNVIMYFNESYALFYITYINNSINGIFYYLCGYIPNFSIIVIIIYILICIILAIVQVIITKSKKSIKFKNRIVNIVDKFLFILILFMFSFIIENCYYLHLPNLDNILFSSSKNKTYEVSDLVELNYYLKDKVLYYADAQERDNGSIIYDDNINEQVIKDLHNIDNYIPLLKGLYPTKSSNLNNNLKAIFGSSTYGLTHFYSTYFDYSMDKVVIFNTIAHEYIHTKGISRENETVFLSSLSGIKSDNIISNYSGYLEAFSRVNYALYDIDYEASMEIEDEVVSKCLTSNYNELCELYTRNSGDYILGSKKLKVSSYFLKNYIGYEEELKNSLSILMNGGGTLYMDGNKVSIDDIINSITSDSNKHFYYERDINSKTYNNIKSAFDNDKLYKAIYQQNSERDISEDKKDIESYYLAPFNNYDYIIINPTISSIDYSYERSARLFLEYFDKVGYN
jgi:hypothetical protein